MFDEVDYDRDPELCIEARSGKPAEILNATFPCEIAPIYNGSFLVSGVFRFQFDEFEIHYAP